MGIPGRNLDRVETRAKVRIGVKKQGQSGKSFPSAVDYFVCDDPEFPSGQPKVLRITLPFATPDENFSTGVERWLKKRSGDGQILTCYSKDSGSNAVALRLTDQVNEGDEVVGEPRGQRTPIRCKADACVFWKDGSCKPMGRLQFFLEGGRTDEALQLDTKSWNTIENLVERLTAAYRRQQDLRGRVFELSVAFRHKGADRFPVVQIQEVGVPIVPNVDLAEAMTAAERLAAAGDVRSALAALLDAHRPGWRDDQAYIDRIKDVGVEVAYAKTLESVATVLA